MKILIVDDLEVNLELLEARLAGSGYEVTCTKNGVEALEKLKKDSFDMIISDILMPKMDGFQLCRECKKDDTLRKIPFVFYTATYTDKKDEEFALSLGAERFIVKPMENKGFMEAIEDVLKNHKEGLLVPLSEMPVEQEEADILKEYNERLVKKLEKKMLDLEKEASERNRAEEEIKHLNLVLNAIRNVNQLIVREKEPSRLLQGVCDNLIVNRGYHTAWIALFDESGRLTNSAEAGLGQDFLPLVERLKSNDLINCQREVLSKSGTVMIGDPLFSCADCPLAEKHRGRIAVTARLEHGGKEFGLLSVSRPAGQVNEKEEQSIFEEVAGDISFALYSLEIEEERKRAEEALHKSEAKFRTIFDNATDGILLVELESRKFYAANEMICQMLDYSLEEIGKLGLMDIHPEQDLPYVIEQFEKQARGEIKLAGDIPMKRRDGSVFYADVNSSPLTLDGQIYMMGIFRDITERKQAEEALEQHQKHLEKKVRERTDELQTMVNAMAGREIRMAELKETIRNLREQLEEAGLTPVADYQLKEMSAE